MPIPFTFPPKLNPFNLLPFSNSIPDGRELKIFTEDGLNIFKDLSAEKDIKLIVDEDISLNISSTYAPLVPANQNTLLSLISGSFTFFGQSVSTGQFKQQGLQIWKSTEPVSFTVTAQLLSQSNSQLEVVEPVKTLIKLTLPELRSKKNGDTGWGLLPPGPNITNIITEEQQEALNSLPILNLKESRGVLGIQIGRYMRFNNVVITKAVPTFSGLVDEYGGPISCQLSLDFVTTEIATTDLIENSLKSIAINPFIN